MSDLHSLSDEELDAARRDVLIEQERRQRIAAIPEQVADLATTYETDGGDRSALVAAITERTDQ